MLCSILLIKVTSDYTPKFLKILNPILVQLVLVCISQYEFLQLYLNSETDFSGFFFFFSVFFFHYLPCLLFPFVSEDSVQARRWYRNSCLPTNRSTDRWIVRITFQWSRGNCILFYFQSRSRFNIKTLNK